MADKKDRYGLNLSFIQFSGASGKDKKYGLDSDDKLKIIEVRVQPRSSLTQSTLATGETVYDSKVVMPTEIVCKCALEIDKGSEPKWKDILELISETYNRVAYDKSKTNLSTIQSKTSVYKYCALESCPHTESAQFCDVFYFDLRFKQMIFVNKDGIVTPDNSSDSDVAYVGNV